MNIDQTKVQESFNPEQLLSDLREMGQRGLNGPGQGRTRLALTAEDKAGRDLLLSWMRALELNVEVDAIGNIFGTLEGASAEAPIMAGSHIDSVDRAGHLDGVYGVLSALAVARAFRQAGGTPPRSLVVAAFTNEEGARFQPDMLGSLVHVGGFPLEQALDLISIDGKRLGDELQAIGYAGAMPPGSIKPAAYMELHVEQGPVLEAEQKQIGVVTGVQGIFWRKVELVGQANHAGGFPIALRRDAGLAAAAIISGLRDISGKIPGTLGTVGSIRFEPNLINVIPGRAEFTIDLRNPEAAPFAQAKQELALLLESVAREHGVEVQASTLADFAPTPFPPEMLALVEKNAVAQGLSSRRIVSGAGHDAQMLARVCPTGMIFVPSKGGYSHCPQEESDDDDLIRGARVLLDCLLELTGRAG